MRLASASGKDTCCVASSRVVDVVLAEKVSRFTCMCNGDVKACSHTSACLKTVQTCVRRLSPSSDLGWPRAHTRSGSCRSRPNPTAGNQAPHTSLTSVSRRPSWLSARHGSSALSASPHGTCHPNRYLAKLRDSRAARFGHHLPLLRRRNLSSKARKFSHQQAACSSQVCHLLSTRLMTWEPDLQEVATKIQERTGEGSSPARSSQSRLLRAKA